MEKIKSRPILISDNIVQYVDAKGYLKILKNKKEAIESVVFVRSKLGSGEFGRFKVEFNNSTF